MQNEIDSKTCVNCKHSALKSTDNECAACIAKEAETRKPFAGWEKK